MVVSGLPLSLPSSPLPRIILIPRVPLVTMFLSFPSLPQFPYLRDWRERGEWLERTTTEGLGWSLVSRSLRSGPSCICGNGDRGGFWILSRLFPFFTQSNHPPSTRLSCIDRFVGYLTNDTVYPFSGVPGKSTTKTPVLSIVLLEKRRVSTTTLSHPEWIWECKVICHYY